MIESVSHDALFEFDRQHVDVVRWVDIGQRALMPSASVVRHIAPA